MQDARACDTEEGAMCCSLPAGLAVKHDQGSQLDAQAYCIRLQCQI